MRNPLLVFIPLIFAGVAAANDGAPDTRAAPKAEPRANCLHETGSRLKRSSTDPCIPAAGRTYDSEQIHESGARDAGEALRLLDPSLTVQRH